ncbi:hypothetical protein ACQKTA_11420 (plasmid) [Enterococcus sp. 22-H-5-01]|uniref:hypothetical protein n=1 Tax=Enterococcus sp. 22-H-5-01 TaxID=3418555 RepID=UPI003D07E9C5
MGKWLVDLIKDAGHTHSGQTFQVTELDSWQNCPEDKSKQLEQHFKGVVTNGVLSRYVECIGVTPEGHELYKRN